MPVAHPSYARISTCAPPVSRSSFPAPEPGFDKALPIAIGEHNADIYRDLLGYPEERVASLQEAGTI